MATTNISNIDGADVVSNVSTGGETILKAAVKLLSCDDKRFAELYVGQMAAEGFNVGLGTKYTVESPTAKVVVKALEAGGKYRVEGYLLINAVMTLAAVRYM